MARGVKLEIKPGEKYGRLTIIKEIEPYVTPGNGRKQRRVLCSCDCDGKEVEVRLSALTRGITVSCGCVRKKDIKPGDKYGRLTIVKEIEPYMYKSGRKERKVLCDCDCGNKNIEVMLNNLLRGGTRSCGCFQKENAKEQQKKYNTYSFCEDGSVIGYTSKEEKFYFDSDDYDIVKEYSWSISDHGYVVARDNSTKKLIRLHRLVMGCVEGDSIMIDHINRNRNDNRKENLRICNILENAQNRSVMKNNTSGVPGVTWNKKLSKWTAYITVNKKRIHLGTFKQKEKAIEIRLKAEKEYFGEFSPNNSNKNT